MKTCRVALHLALGIRRFRLVESVLANLFWGKWKRGLARVNGLLTTLADPAPAACGGTLFLTVDACASGSVPIYLEPVFPVNIGSFRAHPRLFFCCSDRVAHRTFPGSYPLSLSFLSKVNPGGRPPVSASTSSRKAV